ncbi:hypothetical protein M514_08219 [Trichuris suis]|uniref:Uncharacterized protein n=1 Tax=Trichuris suis TaxID=68888 RepID=A0A085M110_9BILA|nr:hypothetical protein M513_08219 [Trichuris suis]KFD65334.1 hypothetical protein M514_08219 [Trichuris suis]
MSEKEDVKRSLVNQKDSHSKDAQPPEKKETTTANKDSEGSSQSTDSLTKTSVDDEYVRKIVREFMEKAKRSAELNEAKSQSEENNSSCRLFSSVKVSGTVDTGSSLDEQDTTDESVSTSDSYNASSEQ